MADNEVSLYLQGGQGQVGGPLVPLLGHGRERPREGIFWIRGQVSGPQVPLLGHGDDKETPNLACRD